MLQCFCNGGIDPPIASFMHGAWLCGSAHFMLLKLLTMSSCMGCPPASCLDDQDFLMGPCCCLPTNVSSLHYPKAYCSATHLYNAYQVYTKA